MKTLYLLGIIYIGLILQGCASAEGMKSPPQAPTPYEQNWQTIKTTPPKDPIKVSFLTPDKKLPLPYEVIGKATVSKFNMAGVKRQEATIRDIMRQLAASVDGDAVIDLNHNKGSVTATVIAYKQKQALV